MRLEEIMKTSIARNEKGMTLMELIIAIAFMGIITLAAYKGMQFAYYTFTSSGEYIEDAYVLQGSMESDLSMVDSLSGSEDASSISLGPDASASQDETLYFNWEAGSGLTDFKTDGVTVEREAEGGGHMDTPVHIFIPVTNEDQ